MIEHIKSIFPPFLKYSINYLLKDFRTFPILLGPRYTYKSTGIFGNRFNYTDNASFLALYDEIFLKEIYKFETEKDSPYIIDCGANIGVSVIYFKKLYPNCKIICFEPDKKIFSVLEKNIKEFGYRDIELNCIGLWKEETTLTFLSDESDSGSLVNKNVDRAKTTKIKTTLLSRYLKDKEVDMLKIDIEGAELEVLKESKEYLKNVKRMFIEYHSFTNENQNLHELIELLVDSGFRINIKNQGLISSKPFIKIDTYAGMDMQLNIFAIRF